MPGARGAARNTVNREVRSVTSLLRTEQRKERKLGIREGPHRESGFELSRLWSCMMELHWVSSQSKSLVVESRK